MNLKSKKGYSLVEIGVGLLILTIFLFCSVAVFNGAYNHYRMIQQRNLAIDLAVTEMERLLQTDSDILTGFFYEELDPTTNRNVLKINSQFQSYVQNTFNDEFNNEFKARYARLNSLNPDAIDSITTEELEEYIFEDKDYVINEYIEYIISMYSDSQFASAELRDGNYAMLVSNVTETGNEALLNPGAVAGDNVTGEMAVRTTIMRLPIANDKAYGNKVLKLAVEVLYTDKINTKNLTDEDVYSITLNTIKIAE